jgi:hypothetical protein
MASRTVYLDCRSTTLKLAQRSALSKKSHMHPIFSSRFRKLRAFPIGNRQWKIGNFAAAAKGRAVGHGSEEYSELALQFSTAFCAL